MLTENESRQKQYFDSLTKRRSEEVASVKSRDENFRDVAAVLARLPRSKKVLDVGCGDGAGGWTEFFLSTGRDVSFLDISSEAVRVLAERLTAAGHVGFTPLAGTFKEVAPQISRQKFDIVFFADTLHHFTEDETISLLEELKPFLHSDSKIVGFEPNGNWPLWRVMDKFNHEYVWEVEKNVLHCTKSGFERKLAKAGMQLESYVYQRIVPLQLVDLSPAFSKLNGLLVKIPIVNQLSSYTILVGGTAASE